MVTIERTRCLHCPVRHAAVCGALSDAELADITSIAHTRAVEPGQVIMSEEADVGFVANILSGVVKLTKTMADGREQIVGLQFPPDFLGRAYRSEAPYTAQALTPVELCTFPRARFDRFLAAHAGLEHRLFEATLDELDAARDWMLLLGRKSAREKVASFVMMIARRAVPAADGTVTLDLPLSRADIADFVGLTIETVSRQLTRLRADGMIRLVGTRTVVVPDPRRLAEAAGGDEPPC